MGKVWDLGFCFHYFIQQLPQSMPSWFISGAKKNEKDESIIAAKQIKNKSKVVTINPQHTKRRREIISLPIMLRGYKDAEGVLNQLIK